MYCPGLEFFGLPAVLPEYGLLETLTDTAGI